MIYRIRNLSQKLVAVAGQKIRGNGSLDWKPEGGFASDEHLADMEAMANAGLISFETINDPDIDDKLESRQGGAPIQFPVLTTAERDADLNPAAGQAIFNSTTGAIEVYDGAAWV